MVQTLFLNLVIFFPPTEKKQWKKKLEHHLGWQDLNLRIQRSKLWVFTASPQPKNNFISSIPTHLTLRLDFLREICVANCSSTPQMICTYNSYFQYEIIFLLTFFHKYVIATFDGNVLKVSQKNHNMFTYPIISPNHHSQTLRICRVITPFEYLISISTLEGYIVSPHPQVSNSLFRMDTARDLQP